MWGVHVLILRPSCRPCRMPAVSLAWEQKLVSACICLLLVPAFLDLRRSPSPV
ncbi:hypothetical protein LEMLEM_LOCUS7520 [Lemmus lemmus]